MPQTATQTLGPEACHTPLQERHNQAPHKKDQVDSQQLKEFLSNIDQCHDSEDEGIEDYVVGGYHPVHIGQTLINRYVVIQKLGWGHFSTVWLCKDFKYNTYVAVKIQKSSPHYMQAAFDEVEILQKVEATAQSSSWPQGRNSTHVVGLLNAFVHKSYYGNHFCMVFEILRCNLLEVIKRYNYEGLPLDLCQEISRQVLKGLDFLHRGCGVIHTDLKPQNVMLCLSDKEIKELVENGQLSSNELFAERMKIMQKMIGMNVPSKNQTKEIEKITILQNKLTTQTLTKNQKKNLKKKIRKQKQKENNYYGDPCKSQDNNSEPEDKEPVNLSDLFDVKKGKIKFNRGEKLQMPFTIKIADLGNACWKHHHFSTQIQTRQYRSPEVILGQNYNETADIWSFGCMMHEMLTGDLLFQPRQTESWSKNDDHLAQIQELIGNFHPHFIARSPKKHKYFQRDGSMKRMPPLNHYPLEAILQIKHRIAKGEAYHFAKFIQMSLIAEPELRASAHHLLQSSWLTRPIPKDYKMSEEDYNTLKQKFAENETQFQVPPRVSVTEEPQEPLLSEESGQDEWTQPEKVANIRLVDRSFTDLGYIGYSEGISLGQLDRQGNWQFSV